MREMKNPKNQNPAPTPRFISTGTAEYRERVSLSLKKHISNDESGVYHSLLPLYWKNI